jgi:hypothetical protein
VTERYRDWLANRSPTESSLREYLDHLPTEGSSLEFKAAEERLGLGVTKSVAALANGPFGGELFLGVTDDRRLVGTTASQQQIEQHLRQENAPPGDWYVVNLNIAVQWITPIQLAGPDAQRRAFVMDVASLAIPAFVLDDDRKLVLYLRTGSNSVRASSRDALEWNRRSTRAKLLLTILHEFETMVRQVRIGSGWDIRVGAGIDPRLPFLVRSLEDGTFYNYLSDNDIVTLLGRRTPSQQGDSQGFLNRFLDLAEQVNRTYARVRELSLPGNVDQNVVSQLSTYPGMLEQDLTAFRQWLIGQRILSA